jgi:hypothetical protein
MPIQRDVSLQNESHTLVDLRAQWSKFARVVQEFGEVNPEAICLTKWPLEVVTAPDELRISLHGREIYVRLLHDLKRGFVEYGYLIEDVPSLVPLLYFQFSSNGTVAVPDLSADPIHLYSPGQCAALHKEAIRAVQPLVFCRPTCKRLGADDATARQL